ncbi:hypothetical protein [Gramella sp. AN32]|uniref:Uncharacterized protein n=1 Tax=Christiangramia antarctica TaxID=2058158 RepID=A0ABW5XAB2_9FLAO|nr:hypothetical protein [Gramella sp. AN32]MCM4157425.1 hypothetical protein [Gramella sp. AN32]
MNSVKKIGLIISALVILFPPVVEFFHIFLKHDHKICDQYAEVHFHKKNVDCQLYKFHKNPILDFEIFNYELVEFADEIQQPTSYYQFLNNYEPLAFDTRGPPLLIYI